MEQGNQYQWIVKSPHMGVTVIENIFITEYMPRANPAYVKVYLYGLMASKNPQAFPLDNGALADLFNITEGDVINAWQYWQDQGIIEVRFAGKDQFIINFFDINEVLRDGKPQQKRPAPASDLYDTDTEVMFEKIQVMYGSRPLSKADMDTFLSWMRDYGFDTGTIILLVEYGLNMLNAKGEHYSESAARAYMKPIAQKWHEAGVTHFKEAENWLTENKKRRRCYYKVLRDLGLNRNPTKKEIEMMSTWLEDWHCDESLIDLALSRASKPSVAYVNSILKKWVENNWRTVEEVNAGDVYKGKTVAGKLSDADRQAYAEKELADAAWLQSLMEADDEDKNL